MYIKSTSVLTLLLAVAACDKIPFFGDAQPGPEEIANLFYQEWLSANVDGARQYAISDSVFDQMELDPSEVEGSTFELGSSRIDGDQAIVETTVTYQMDGTAVPVEFETFLVKGDDGWKVNADTTFQVMAVNMFGQLFGTTAEDLENLGQAFGDALTRAAEDIAEAIVEEIQQQREVTAPQARRPATPQVDLPEIPWEPEFVGTIAPGMTREDVIAIWGEPVTERFINGRGYMFFRNGCENSCGTYDIVLLEANQVVDAVVRGAGHEYSGMSSSPVGRAPEITLPVTEQDTTTAQTL